MRISFNPQYRDDGLILKRQGDKITINGVTLDFSNLPDGGIGESEEIPTEFLVGPVRRVNGEIQISIIRPYTDLASVDDAFPKPIVLSDGQTIKINEPKMEKLDEDL